MCIDRCLASDDEGRTSPFRMLDEVAHEFFIRYGSEYTNERQFSLNAEFNPIIKRFIKKYSISQETNDSSTSSNKIDTGYSNKKNSGMDNIRNLKTDLENAKESVQKNISQVVDNSVQIDSLSVQTESLLDTSAAFRQSATKLERTKRWESIKFKLLAAIGFLFLFYLLLTRVCDGFSLSTCI